MPTGSITRVSVSLPVLKTARPALSALRVRAIETEGLLAVDVTETAQSAHTYPGLCAGTGANPGGGFGVCGSGSVRAEKANR